ncbi:MAG: rRNA pseudouridine synthase [Lachnospiraceae bacterium]|nr:rRNA pseudouridine synthase [Lachnospiraceae bacterium]
MRLDRFLALTNAAKSRSDAKKLLKTQALTVNGEICRVPEQQIDTETDTVMLNGKQLVYRQYRYFLLNKPDGVISATKDRISDTVLSLVPEADAKDYFPVGRLDKDTEGLLLVTNDGAFAHNLTSPSKKMPKTYLATVTGRVSEEGINRLESGIVFSDFTSKPAKYEFISEKDGCSDCLLTITEGHFHQVKRMFHAVGNEVVYLKRIAIGGLTLPEDLKPGEYREYTREQLDEAIYGMD